MKKLLILLCTLSVASDACAMFSRALSLKILGHQVLAQSSHKLIPTSRTEVQKRSFKNNWNIEKLDDDTEMLDTTAESKIAVPYEGEITCHVKDGDNIISGSDDCAIRIWNKNTGEYKRIIGHENSVTCLAIDGDKIISGSCDYTIKIWNKNTHACEKTLEGHKDYIESLTIDGDTIISGADDGTIKIWNKHTGKCMKTFNKVGKSSIMFGDKIISTLHNTIIILNRRNAGLRVKTLEGHKDSVLCLAMYGDMIISGSADKTIKIWNKNTGECEKTLKGHKDWVLSLTVDGDKLISESYDNIKVWDLWSELLRIK